MALDGPAGAVDEPGVDLGDGQLLRHCNKRVT
jgi:hypothetical protein